MGALSARAPAMRHAAPVPAGLMALGQIDGDRPVALPAPAARSPQAPVYSGTQGHAAPVGPLRRAVFVHAAWSQSSCVSCWPGVPRVVFSRARRTAHAGMARQVRYQGRSQTVPHHGAWGSRSRSVAAVVMPAARLQHSRRPVRCTARVVRCVAGEGWRLGLEQGMRLPSAFIGEERPSQQGWLPRAGGPRMQDEESVHSVKPCMQESLTSAARSETTCLDSAFRP
ncbi:hypothetical protein SAM23877_0048 [Streptomyces ambofaciens ATCC 23877]|uniref:Uncharacterized protein n=1 Tax=Streptomyces ambofaciens (strain ATCC 23877 / 3486 / DSM 40053 / JCM 4204 / NBRC 12836 / NRRL B-2516) TaxID=278992 RepID=A0A0K2AJS5_STRA7|nr:hypothetical protein SAM23877_0048 [Streptomyces ambofaciens ATCC 23877]